MFEGGFWFAAAVAVLACVGGGWAAVRGLGVVRIHRYNTAALAGLRRRRGTAEAPEKEALDAVIRCCGELRRRWVLREADLNLTGNTRRLVVDIAGSYHPRSAAPEKEARLGRLLEAFMEVKTQVLALTRLRGIRAATRFRLRHALTLSRAWKKKREWEASRLGQAVSRYKLYFVFKWLYALYRCLDISFWAMKMLGYFFYDIVLKIFLVRWYLLAGEQALLVYSDRKAEPAQPADGLLDDFDSLPETGGTPDASLTPRIREIAEASRKRILYGSWTVEWEQVRGIYFDLVEDIAGYYHPASENPLYEARLYTLLQGLARFADRVASLQTTPVLNKLLDFRLSHLLMAKDTADYFRDSRVMEWINKYHLHRVVKYTSLIYKVVAKRHPGVLFKDFAFTLALEGGKRWVYLYLHEKIVEDADFIFRGR